MKLIAKVESAVEMQEDPSLGKHLVFMWEVSNKKTTGQFWMVFQGSKNKCEILAEQINSGFEHFDILSKTN